MIRCAKCLEELPIGRAMVLWNDDSGKDAVVVHQGKCNIREFRKSGGAAYGKYWFKRSDVVSNFTKLNPQESEGLKSLHDELKDIGAL